MIYTLGQKETYDKYIKSDENASKGIDGSVWKTYLDAEVYLKKALTGFAIYGVEADWDNDTIIPNPKCSYRSLKRIGKLVMLNEPYFPY